MKQILQDLKSGDTTVAEVPTPPVSKGQLKIKTTMSLISAGTERMLASFGKASYLGKAMQQPEKVAQVLRKARTDGIAATVTAVQSKLREPQPLGYSNVGVVTEIGEGVAGFRLGDRVVSNGWHAEIVCVPKNLCATIPDEVSDENAAFTVVSSIGLQGVRLTQPSLGESFVVYGLGLIGIITAQLLKANGCRVLGLDVDSNKVELASELGIEAVDLSTGVDPVVSAHRFSHIQGVDGVLITASSKDSEIIRNSAKMCRKRGRITLVGVVGLNIDRSDFYEKEITFQVSCSYGPGRYDPEYENQGNDYPIGFVRWTEQRNFQAVLEMMSTNALNVQPLVSSIEPIENAPEVYERVTDGSVVTVILTYPEIVTNDTRTISSKSAADTIVRTNDSNLRVAVIGAGDFTRAQLVPVLSEAEVELNTIVSNKGLSSSSLANQFRFLDNSNDASVVFQNEDVNAVFITTRHDSHGKYVLEALNSDKHVYVEKPLTIYENELDEIQALVGNSNSTGPRIMVGFNRRFAPLVLEMKNLLKGRQHPITAIYTVNAGDLPSDHWHHDARIGGGRVLSEACHFIDLLAFLIGYPIVAVSAMQISDNPDCYRGDDKVSILLEFNDGSHGTVHYYGNGSRKFPKERLELFSEGRILQLNNFRNLKKFGFSNSTLFSMPKLDRLRGGQDKGHANAIHAFINAIKHGMPDPIEFNDIVNSSRASFAAVASAKSRQPIRID